MTEHNFEKKINSIVEGLKQANDNLIYCVKVIAERSDDLEKRIANLELIMQANDIVK